MTNKDKYRIFAENNPDICLYDRPWFLDAVCKNGSWDVLIYEKNNDIAGFLVYFVKERFGLKYITQPLLTQHNGIWLKYPSGIKGEKKFSFECEAVSYFIGELEKGGFVSYFQCFSPDFTNWMPFYWNGYRQNTDYTFLLSTGNTPYPEICKAYSKTVRYDIRKAEEALNITESDDIDAFYFLHNKTFERQNMTSTVSHEFLKSFDSECVQNKARKLLFADSPDGKHVCAAYLVYDDKCVYYLMSGTDSEYRNMNALSLLIDAGIRFAAETGRDFDFEGSMVEGIADYFRKFGGKLTPYFNITKTYTKNPVLRLLINKKLNH